MDRIDAKRTRLAPVLVIVAGLVVLAVMLFRVPLATVFTVGLLLVCPLLMMGCTEAVTVGDMLRTLTRSGPIEGAGAKAGPVVNPRARPGRVAPSIPPAQEGSPTAPSLLDQLPRPAPRSYGDDPASWTKCA